MKAGQDRLTRPRLRLAAPKDADQLRELIRLSTQTLLARMLSAQQVAESHRFMTLDTQLIEDRTYFVAAIGNRLAGCGGWSRRATDYGGDTADRRDLRLLDPASEPARVRAMYTHPDLTRLGIGRMILESSEAAARSEGFSQVLLFATVGGEPLYRACGYRELSRQLDGSVPIVRMIKDIA
ncbi:MAG: GNAT family N-acetyltransferase [Croceicoccus sp.]|nr:GNAT family N-acetyltransferase [Croceicoccus sp.]MAL25712.1 GNAT family N-acetyltransferase [Croceicoccus sp.]